MHCGAHFRALVRDTNNIIQEVKHMPIPFEYISDYDTDTERVCGTCGELKPLTAFYKDGKYSNGKDRYRRDCKDCYKMRRFKEFKRRMEDEY